MPDIPLIKSAARRRLYDLLEEKTLELISERNKLDSIFNSLLEGALTVDKQCNITAFNRSAERISGWHGEYAVGKKCWEILNSYFCAYECPLGISKKAASVEASPSFKEIFILRKDGRKIPVRLATAPLYDADKRLIGAVDTFQDISELKNLSAHLEERFRLHDIIGKSPAMEKIYWLIENVSKSDSTVLITGESGVGKELVARAIHLNSHRRAGAFIALNCSAYAESLIESELFGHEKGAFTGAVQSKPGKFESAQGGTLFLDEIGDLSPTLQVKLLRVLETRWFERVGGAKPIKLDVRLIAATNKNLGEETRRGIFREDLYYRINVINLHLPPLRERREDIPLLTQNLIVKFSRKFNKSIAGVTPGVMNLLCSYGWPGNVRELENVLEHAFAMCHQEEIDLKHLPAKLQTFASAFHNETSNEIPITLEDNERELIVSTLRKMNNSRKKTAEKLGIGKATLWRKLKRYGIE